MKKILVMTMMLLSAVVMNANGWEKTYVAGDELRGTESTYVYAYFDNVGAFYFYENTNHVCIATREGIFNYGGEGLEDDELTSVIIGFYDNNGNLVDKLNSCEFYLFNEKQDKAFSICTWKNDIVIDYLKHKTGYVRVLADRYGDYDFDIKVPCFNNNKKSANKSHKRKTTKRKH